MRRYRKAKIVATVGPASESCATLRALFLAGADTFRLNFSHGSHDVHFKVHNALRAMERDVGRPVGIIQDLQGPKIRIGHIERGSRLLQVNESVRFTLDTAPGEGEIALPHPEIFAAIAPGCEFFIDDGRVRFVVERCDSSHLDARVLVGGVISSRKGVNLPGTILDLSPLTPKDRLDLAFGLELGVDWIALSFVQRPSDLIEARALIGDRAGLIAKIEKPSALDRIEDIIALSDAIMVARGDLGVEMPPEDVPGRQKELIRLSRQAAKPVIVATQMLDSMVGSPTPTRAEVSDVATAIYDGADAVMLSAESATGSYPVEAVSMMDRIIRQTERHKLYPSLVKAVEPEVELSTSHAVAAAAAGLASSLSASAIVAFTASGTTVARIARKRPPVQILAVTVGERVLRQMCLLWGAHSVRSDETHDYEEMVERAAGYVTAEGFGSDGDLIVVVAGIPFGTAGTTNNLRVIELKRS
jgi:pyruvate kinase